MRVIGLISGTSLDAIDVAIVDLALRDTNLEIGLVHCAESPWPEPLRSRLEAWLAPGATVGPGELALASMEVGEAFAAAALATAEASGVPAESVDLVASHGQTLHHLIGSDGRARATLQIGEPAVIAERTGRTVVADFRPRDIAAGGEGAPLVSFVDALAFGRDDADVAVLNLGGIANLTWVPAARARDAVAFDTGPGNAVIDALARALLAGRYDDRGAVAASGRADEALLADLLADPFFRQPPPKSTGRERFGAQYAEALRTRGDQRGLSAPDLLATATELTARSVAAALASLVPRMPERLFVGGGGVRNRTLLAALRAAVDALGADGPIVEPVDVAGFDAAAKEAIAFAVLGHEALHGRPNSLPGGTGARHPSVLGAIWPGTNYRQLLRQVAESSGNVDRIVMGAEGSTR